MFNVLSEIININFTGNIAESTGGAIQNSRDSNCNVESCNFTDCHTKNEDTTRKAAIYNEGTLTQNNCIYKDSPKPDPIATVIMSSPVTTVYNGNKYLVATLKDINNKTLSEFEVSVNLDGVKKLKTDENGQVKVSTNGLTPKTYDVLIAFAGNENYTASNTTTSVTVNKDATSLTAGAVAPFYNISKKLVVTLKDSNGVLAKKKVTVKVGAISKTLTTNSKGQVSVDISTLVPKAYTASVKFAGDANYKASTKSVKVTVKKANTKLVASSKAFKVKATKKVTAILKDYKNRVIKNRYVTFKVAGKTYKVKTNSEGVATATVKITKKGSFSTAVSFAGDKYYNKCSRAIKITVK